jgi:hypothetical protein
MAIAGLIDEMICGIFNISNPRKKIRRKRN